MIDEIRVKFNYVRILNNTRTARPRERAVEIYNSEFPFNNGWKVKQSDNCMSPFFPDSWAKQKVHQELAIAFENRIHQGYNIWHGTMSDGVTVQFHIDNNIIRTAFPKF